MKIPPTCQATTDLQQAVSGPNLAKEIASGHITGTVIASDHPQLNHTVQALFTQYYRVGYALAGVVALQLDLIGPAAAQLLWYAFSPDSKKRSY